VSGERVTSERITVERADPMAPARAEGPERGLELERRMLASRVPVLGAALRLWAVRRASARLLRGDVRAIPLLVDAADSRHRPIARRAREVLRSLEAPSLLDALALEAARRPASAAGAIFRETGRLPSDPEEACLLLFVTGQLDRYFAEDDDFRALRLAYERADETVRANVLSVVRSGDRRCLGFLGARKRLPECTEREIFLALQSFFRHGEWPRLLRAFLELPLKYGWHVLRRLEASGWEPEEPELRSLLRQAIAEARSQWTPEASRQGPSCELLDRLLDRGRRGPFSRLEPEDLLRRLAVAEPLQGVSIVAALAPKVAPESVAARRVAESPHWLVRLAGHLTGLTTDVVRDEVIDPVRWVSVVAPARGVLELWPARATPAHLEALASAPPDAWKGHLGATRRILRALIASRVTTGRFEDLVVEGDPFAGEFQPVSALEWESELGAPADGPSVGKGEAGPRDGGPLGGGT
jgi:hypothetical protein